MQCIMCMFATYSEHNLLISHLIRRSVRKRTRNPTLTQADSINTEHGASGDHKLGRNQGNSIPRWEERYGEEAKT